MAAKKVKKVTEIPEANVKIEVEQTEEKAENEKEEVAESSEEKEETEEATEEASEIKEELKEPVLSSFDEEPVNSSISWKKVFVYTVVSAFIGVLILGGLLFALNNYDLNLSKKADNKSIVLPSTTPEPTEAAKDEVDKEAYKIEVLNGSGIAGEAATVQTLLEDAGFSVSGIGNAETADFTETVIYAGDEIDGEFVNELSKILEERGPVEVENAPSSQTEDVVVIVGSETSDSDSTPTPTQNN